MNTYYAIRRVGRPHPIYLSFMSNFVLLFIAFPGLVVTLGRAAENQYPAALMAAATTIIAADALTALYIVTCQALLSNDAPDSRSTQLSKLAILEAIADYVFWPNSIIVAAGAYALIAGRYAATPEIWAIITVPIALAVILLSGYTEARWGARYIGPKRVHQPDDTAPQRVVATAKAKRTINVTKIAGTALLVFAAMLITRNFPIIFPAIIGTTAVAAIAAGRIPSARLRHRRECEG